MLNKHYIKKFIEQQQLAPLHQLGQHFLLDYSVIRKIIEAAELKSDDTVLEIGTGTGELTAALAEKAGKIISVEQDRKLASAAGKVLKQQYAVSFKSNRLTSGNLPLNDRSRGYFPKYPPETPPKIEIIAADALKLSPNAYRLTPHKYKIVANLPYSITGAFFRKFLDFKTAPSVMVVMIQKEVAERILKKESPFDLLGIIVRFYGQAALVAPVKRSAFWPRPAVDSAVVKIVIKKEPNRAKIEQSFLKLVRAAFGQRRKTLLNALSHGLKKPKPFIGLLLKRAKVDSTARAEQLSLVQWITLSTEAEKLKL